MKILYKLWMFASPLISCYDRSRPCVCARVRTQEPVCEMKTFLASLLNLSTSYREL